MDTLQKLIQDSELDAAFGNANFGDISKRDLIKNTLLKYACGFTSGHTARCILVELKLATNNQKLTSKGKEYLWEAYSEGKSF